MVEKEFTGNEWVKAASYLRLDFNELDWYFNLDLSYFLLSLSSCSCGTGTPGK